MLASPQHDPNKRVQCSVFEGWIKECIGCGVIVVPGEAFGERDSVMSTPIENLCFGASWTYLSEMQDLANRRQIQLTP
jgi:capsid protein